MTDVPAALIVKYSCVCGIEKAAVAVPFRTAKENAVEYVRDVVAPLLVEDHKRRSPKCRPTSFKEVWIPINKENAVVGEPIKK